ncbi:MAG TPA: bluf domain protein [Microscillaceae bacterium]|nr:bluf domain protein [Microscillaceae bacterium]
MLSELIYVSRRSISCTDKDVEQILEASIRRNSKKGLTGVLLYSQTQFIQVLEGESDVILNLYDHIKKDKRHKNALLVSLKLIEKRYFPSWQMGSKKIGDNYEFLTQLNSQEKDVFQQLITGINTHNNTTDIVRKVFSA